MDKVNITSKHNYGLGPADCDHLLNEVDYIAFHMQETALVDNQLASDKDIIKIKWCYNFRNMKCDDILNNIILNVLPRNVVDVSLRDSRLVMSINCQEADMFFENYTMSPW